MDATSAARTLTLDLDRVPLALAGPLEWRRTAAGEVERFRLDKRVWQRYPAWVALLLEGLERRQELAEIELAVLRTFSERVPEELVRHRVRKQLHKMHQEGIVEMAFPPPPTTFGGRWDQVRELGRGGVGIVYLCRDRGRGEPVAVKRPWGYYAPLARTAASVASEAAVLAHLDHPGIVRSIASFEQDGLPHLAREAVEGTRLDRAMPLPADQLIGVARTLVELVAHAHERGLLLLDLQPSNFLLREGGPVLVDAGLAAHMGADGRAHFARPIGSRGYAAPEMRASREATVRSDVWALGRLLFAVATGTAPQQPWGEEEIARRLMRGPLDDLIRALVRDRPEDRPVSASDVLSRLPASPR